jgi:hypothetical protein
MTNNNDAVNATANVTDAVKELAAMADRELRSDARKALVDVEEAVAELLAIIEEQKAEIKLLRAELNEARREVCELVVYNSRNYHDGEEKECAKDREWDCFPD